MQPFYQGTMLIGLRATRSATSCQQRAEAALCNDDEGAACE